MTIDLDAYFRRIGYRGPRSPSLETLRSIHLLHPQAIAFENLDPLMKRPVPLDPESLERKLVKGGRGGYCYEHNLLLGDVLKSLGFSVKGLSARVVRELPPSGMRPRTHMLLRIDLEGDVYLADVGFGISALTSPLRLAPDIEQPTPHETFRLAELDRGFELQVRFGGEWNALYQFDLQEQLVPDYEMCNWYTSTHPNSQFVTDLMVARADEGCRHTLRNNAYAMRPLTGQAERRTLESVEEMRSILQDVFRIVIPESPELEEVLKRIAGS